MLPFEAVGGFVKQYRKAAETALSANGIMQAVTNRKAASHRSRRQGTWSYHRPVADRQ